MTPREIDAEISEKIFGLAPWKPFVRSIIPGEPCGGLNEYCNNQTNHYKYFNETLAIEANNENKPPEYSMYLPFAFLVVDKLFSQGWRFGFVQDDNGWEINAYHPDIKEPCPSCGHIKSNTVCVWEETLPMAICKAALETLKCKK